MFVFLYLCGGKVRRHIADHRVESLEGYRHGHMTAHEASQLGAETQPTESALGRSCGEGVPPSPPLSAGIQTVFVERARCGQVGPGGLLRND